MDSSTVEHSDSDSGESWTLLENSATYGDKAPDTENAANHCAREHADDHSDKDEDTDGISIISDSEPEATPFDLNDIKVPTEELSEKNPVEQQEMTLSSSPPTNNNNIEPVREETDFLGDNAKYKTYVHKRNPKVGSILDIIMLGTFVITAGMALGHLWSCKNECTTQTSVNKILSSLYKLQEENTVLRSKLKEITEATSYQVQQRKSVNNKSNKQHRCKKIFEDPVMKNNKVETAIKCADGKPDLLLHSSPAIPEHEKEFLNDIDKMKDIYEQNKDWLDKEVNKQYDDFRNKQNVQLKFEKQLGPISIPLGQPIPIQDIVAKPEYAKTHKQIIFEKQVGSTYHKTMKTKPIQGDNKTDANGAVKNDKETHLSSSDNNNAHNPDNFLTELFPEKKITYADSLKIDQPLQRNKRNENELPNRMIRHRIGKRKHKDEDTILNVNTFSEDDITKDDRYNGPKLKNDKKKQDRQKLHKRQKRINKYEQWEMKGGYLKDFDEFSVTSSQDNIPINMLEKKFLNTDFENYVNKLIEAENNASNKDMPKITKNDERANKSEKRLSKSEKRKKGKTKDNDWYNQRSSLRAEARLKLEQQLFGENTSNNAAWYFRRMQKREQCRAQKNNSTVKKFSKHKMNFKMKR